MQLLENTFTGKAVLVGSSNEQRPQLHSPAFPVIFSNGKILDSCPNTAGIYYWQNTINGKGYVGQSLKIRGRIFKYVAGRFTEQRALYAAFQKYGLTNFTCYKVMDGCPSKVALNYWETYWIKELDTFGPNGYNLTPGGSNTMTAETRRKIGDYFRGKQKSDEHRRKIREAKAYISPETRLRLSIALRGKKMSAERYSKCVKNGCRLRGTTRSIEDRRKISLGQTGKKRKPFSDEHRRNLVRSHLLYSNTLWKMFFDFGDGTFKQI